MSGTMARFRRPDRDAGTGLGSVAAVTGKKRTYVVTGAASGIGAATTQLLRDDGHRVVTVDLRGADVVADLSTPRVARTPWRASARLTDVVHGLVPCAGVAGLTGVDPELVASVNYFGSVELVRGLRPQLAAAGGASVVLLASNSITAQPGWASEVTTACLQDDEDAARAAAAETEAVHVYPATKAALAYWARREGVKEEWVGRASGSTPWRPA